MSNETSSALFSLTVFMTCGSKEVAVHIPAANPMTGVHSMKLTIQIFSHRILCDEVTAGITAGQFLFLIEKIKFTGLGPR